MWSDLSEICTGDPTPKAGLDSWPCYFNENNKTLSTSGDEDDKPAKIFLTYSKLILMISVFFILFSGRFYRTAWLSSPHPLSEDWSLHWWSIQLDDGNIFMLFSWILFNQNSSQPKILYTEADHSDEHGISLSLSDTTY